MQANFIDSVPLWLQQCALLVSLPLFVEVGLRLQRMGAGSATRPDSDRAVLETVFGALLSLLGLLLAFTVSMAVENHGWRKQLVRDEANAISTTYLRVQLLDEPALGRMSILMDHYARDRGLVQAAGEDRDEIDIAEAVTDRNQALLWAATGDALNQPDHDRWIEPFLETMNGMFDLAANRQSSLEVRLPPRVIHLSIVCAIATALCAGYASGVARSRRRVMSTALFLLIAMVLGLILDLDQPRSGRVILSEEPLARVAAQIHAAELTKHSRSITTAPSASPRGSLPQVAYR